MQFYVAEQGRQTGPFTIDQLRAMGLRPDIMVWREGMAQWMPAGNVAELAGLFARPMPSPAAPYATYATPAVYPGGTMPPNAAGNKVAAGICGILLGGLGIHKFVLGYTGAGLTMLLVTILTCGFGGMVMGIIGLIEGIIYLTKSDEEFYETYVVRKKEWF